MIEYSSLIELGNRTVQEDAIVCLAQNNGKSGDGLHDGCLGFFALADGLGGHGFGEVASAIVVESARDTFFSKPGDLDACFISSQKKLIDEQTATGAKKSMMTTLVLLCFFDGYAQWGHIGDSRMYFFKRKKLVSHTLDHSVPQMLAAIGEIKEKDIRHHPDRNRLLRSMGIEWNEPRYELSEKIPLEGNESFLLCSDGFWEWIDEKKMSLTLRQAKNPADWLQRMEKIASANAGKSSLSNSSERDNYSAITVWIR
ncbi:MAG: protein phosphatase 2C domain-containing protein [Coriobacteriia bacterium]|nr:protein phosphatase 2C domain-containing protein [Coriobacteriia bacterium]